MFTLGFDSAKKRVISGFGRKEPDLLVQKSGTFIGVYKTGNFVGLQVGSKSKEASADSLGMSF